jgi:GT2 family glycosyltransferase
MILDVMVPHYGDSGLLKLAVRSVLAQTHPDWRLTVVDDGQEAGLPEWFADLGDERVRFTRNVRNLGLTGNFQRCVDLAESEHLVIMGNDDVMLPNYVDTVQKVLAEHPGATMVQPGVEVIDGRGEVTTTLVDQMKRRLYAPKITGRTLMEGEDLAASLLRGNWLYFPSICWRTEAVRKVNFRPELKTIQDLALVIDLIRLGGTLAIDPTVCFRYRRHLSASAAEALAGTRFTEARHYFVDVADGMRAHGWPRAARAARRYLSSRLHAATLLPTALRSRNGAGLRALLRHAVGPARR